MKKVILFTLIVLFTISISSLITSCGKKVPLPENKKNFVGTWVSETQDTLVIRANGEGNAHVGNTTISGGAVAFPDAYTISIKAIGLGPTMKINQAPQETEGKLKMVLDGTTYTKQ